jgi:phosphohistidine phosphatase
MKLYFLRHADALEGADDRTRSLSERGKAQCKQIGVFCRHAAIVFDAAYTSPIARARETAELVLGVTNLTRPITLAETETLLNETSPSAFSEWLNTLPAAKQILLVGHAPSLTDRARYLLGISQPDSFKLPKAGLACLTTEDRQKACLKFFVSPKFL